MLRMLALAAVAASCAVRSSGAVSPPASGAAHTNVTLRRIVAMRTLRDGVNVHGAVVGWTGEDLHFENQVRCAHRDAPRRR